MSSSSSISLRWTKKYNVFDAYTIKTSSYFLEPPLPSKTPSKPLPTSTYIYSSKPLPHPPAITDIFLDINEPYTLNLIHSILKSKACYNITLGAHEGDSPVVVDSSTFQFSEYERCNWSSLRIGKGRCSNFCVRKGLSRKAQMWNYSRRYCSKNGESILKNNIPKTIVIETWSVFESDDNSVVMGDGTRVDFTNLSIPDRLKIVCGDFLQMQEDFFKENKEGEVAADTSRKGTATIR